MERIEMKHSVSKKPALVVWFERNVALAVPLIVIALFSLIFSIGLLLASALFEGMKSTDIFKSTWKTVERSAIVFDQMGSPVKQGWMISGSIKLEGPAGEANFTFPVQGPKAKGDVLVRATKSDGQWTYQLFELQINNKRMDLLQDSEYADRTLLDW